MSEIVDDGVTGFVRPDVGGMAQALVAVARLDRSAFRAAVEAWFSMQRMTADHLRFYADVLSHDVAGGTTPLEDVA